MDVDFATALDKTMEELDLSDEQVAIELGVRAKAVYEWRRGIKIPNTLSYQRLRFLYPAFADRIDAQQVRRKVTSPR